MKSVRGRTASSSIFVRHPAPNVSARSHRLRPLSLILAVVALVALGVYIAILSYSLPVDLVQVRNPTRVSSSTSRHPQAPQPSLESVERADGHSPSASWGAPALSKECFAPGAEGCYVQGAVEPATPSVLVAVLSDAGDAAFRQAARSTWVPTAAKLEGVRVLFYVSQTSPGLEAEAAAHDDLVLDDDRSIDRSLPQVLRMFAYVATHSEDARFILRVDARSYVAVPHLLRAFFSACPWPACSQQPLWAGGLALNRTLAADALSTAFAASTHLPSRLPYMIPDAYIISQPLAASIVYMHRAIGLRSYGSEELSMGAWMLAAAYTKVDLASPDVPGACVFVAAGLEPVLDVCRLERAPCVLPRLSQPAQMVQAHADIMQCFPLD